MIGQRRNIIARVIWGHDDVALRGEHCSNRGAFDGIGKISDVGGLLRGSAVRIEHDWTRASAAGIRPGREHECPAGGCSLTLGSHSPVFDVVRRYAADGRSGEVEQLLSRGG